MATDSASEGRQLAGAQTTDEERAGIEQLTVSVVGRALQLEQAVAPVGEARVVVINRHNDAVTVELSEQGRDGPVPIASWQLGSGESKDRLLHLREGEYELSGLLADGSPLTGARLTVQPQPGHLGGSQPNRSAFPAPVEPEVMRSDDGFPSDPEAGQRIFPGEPGAENEESFAIAEAAADDMPSRQ